VTPPVCNDVVGSVGRVGRGRARGALHVFL